MAAPLDYARLLPRLQAAIARQSLDQAAIKECAAPYARCVSEKRRGAPAVFWRRCLDPCQLQGLAFQTLGRNSANSKAVRRVICLFVRHWLDPRCVSQPPRVSAHVDHRHRAARLKLRDQFEKEGRRSLAAGGDDRLAVRIAAERAMCSYASEIKMAVALPLGERAEEWLSEGRIPLALQSSGILR